MGGGSREKRTNDVSCGQNRYARLPLKNWLVLMDVPDRDRKQSDKEKTLKSSLSYVTLCL